MIYYDMYYHNIYIYMYDIYYKRNVKNKNYI